MKLITDLVKIPLLGHGLQFPAGNIASEPLVEGRLAADTVAGTDGKEYAVFTIADDGTQPAGWAGTYRLTLDRLIQYTTDTTGNCRIIRKEV